MEITNKQFNIIISILAGIVIWLLLSVFASILDDTAQIKRYIIALGGGFSGYIQAICYGLATFAYLELRSMGRYLNGEFEAFQLNLLPTKEHLVLSPDEVAKIKLSIIEMEKQGFKNILMDLIKKTCNQFRNENSISDTYNVLSTQVRTTKEAMEADLEMVRYLISAISMLGFLGTVLGLTDGIYNSGPMMMQVNPAEKLQGLQAITGDFSMAFGTTFVALLLMLWVSRKYAAHLAKLDTYFSKVEDYVIENLISRIFKNKK